MYHDMKDNKREYVTGVLTLLDLHNNTFNIDTFEGIVRGFIFQFVCTDTDIQYNPILISVSVFV